MSKGTGIVTSVPSDSPDDYINLLNFKNDEKLRNKWGITEEMIFEPVHIINLEGFSGLAAKDVVEKLKIKSPKEKEKLQKTKLDIIKYNKNMQNIMDINLTNYKFYSKKYIIYEENGKGKEYYENGNLIFEGEYLNGKRNGKGKEYNYNGKLKFDGEYLNGERNGRGKEYSYYYNYLIFEGESLNGMRWNGKGYDINNKISYELKNGKGFVKEKNLIMSVN